jgi:S1-C subfamily serine protease
VNNVQQDWAENTAALEHLTGPSRGYVAWLAAPELSVFVGEDRLLRVRTDPTPKPGEARIATLRREGAGYRIDAMPEAGVRINRQPATSQTLQHGDTLEFGEVGPLSRFRLLGDRKPIRWPIGEMIGDSISYARFSRKPLGTRVAHAIGGFLRRLTTDTTILFRVTVVAALVILVVAMVFQYKTSRELREAMERETLRLEGMAAALANSRAEALRPSDLTALREELSQRMLSARSRIEALERSSAMAGRVIAAATRSVVLLQGSYGMRHIDSDRMLRHVLGPDGIPMIAPNGQPLLSPKSNGPVAEVYFTGTGFIHAGTRRLVTNRHVAVPWEGQTDKDLLSAQGLEPVILRFIAYFPEIAEPVTVKLAAVSEEADLAILTSNQMPDDGRGLTLAASPPWPGQEVIVMGYPTGLRSLLAQAGAAFVEELQEAKDTDFWSVSARLARAGLIAPLASRGIVGKVGTAAIVYDAETTHGGSGGPVLNAEGEVIAINSAILPEFGGSNLGIPVDALRNLLADQTP